jgi:hypothetical protein
MLKIDSDGTELCLFCGQEIDGVLVERAGKCASCGREVEGA